MVRAVPVACRACHNNKMFSSNHMRKGHKQCSLKTIMDAFKHTDVTDLVLIFKRDNKTAFCLSQRCLGELLATSFCERLFSTTKIVWGVKSTSTKPSTVEKKQFLATMQTG